MITNNSHVYTKSVDIPAEAQAEALIRFTLTQVRDKFGIPPEIKLKLCDRYGKTIGKKQTCEQVCDERGDTLVVNESEI